MSAPQMIPPFLFAVTAANVPALNAEGWQMFVMAFDEAHAIRTALKHHPIRSGQPITVVQHSFVVGDGE